VGSRIAIYGLRSFPNPIAPIVASLLEKMYIRKRVEIKEESMRRVPARNEYVTKGLKMVFSPAVKLGIPMTSAIYNTVKYWGDVRNCFKWLVFLTNHKMISYFLEFITQLIIELLKERALYLANKS
jgi:hypothetical protein